MKKTSTKKDDARSQIRPLSAEEINAVSGGANAKKPQAALPQSSRGSSRPVTKSHFFA
ncbi:hypothetical protein ACFWP0_23160 [Achromobacter sp. NPDC058515]|uniref:hypothetical protein n=1 Tax=Achromobacter sp. NPDC058515 TaxID=3346533 RepID=UPI00364A8ED1